MRFGQITLHPDFTRTSEHTAKRLPPLYFGHQRQRARTLPLDEFFLDYFQTAMESGELLTEIHVPAPTKPGWAHIKFTPRSVEDFATVGVAITLSV